MKRDFFEGPAGRSYVRAVMPDGLTVMIAETPEFKGCYAVFGTRYGSRDLYLTGADGEKVLLPPGTAHFLEHKLFESEEGDAFDLFSETGAAANAYTGFDRTCYLFSCTHRFDENLDSLIDFVRHPYFTPETVRKEQGIIGQEIGMYDDNPGWITFFNALEMLFPNHPVAVNIAGTAESIAKIDAPMLYDCYRSFYAPENMFLCIGGPVDADALLSRLKERFSEPPAGLNVPREYPLESEPPAEHYREQAMAVATPLFNLSFKIPIETPERSLKTRVCFQLLGDLLIGDSSPLYKQLTEAGLITEAPDVSFFCGTGYAALMIEGESEDPRAVEQAVYDEIDRLKEKGFDRKRFSAVRCAQYGNFIRELDRVKSLVSGMVNLAFEKEDVTLFDELQLLKTVSVGSVTKRLQLLSRDRAVLSVVVPENERKEEE